MANDQQEELLHATSSQQSDEEQRQSTENAEQRARSGEAAWLFKYIMFAQVAVYMEAGAVPALLNELVHIFGMSYAEQGLLGGIVYITISLGCPLATFLFQNFSPKYVLTWSLIFNNAAVIVFAATPLGYSRCFIGARVRHLTPI